MSWIEKNYEKVVLGVVAVAAIGLGVSQMLQVTSFKEKFPVANPTKQKKMPEPESINMQQARDILGKEGSKPLFVWRPQEISIPGSNATKELTLMTSVKIVEHNNRLFDLADPTEDPIRRPVPNSWLLKYKLQILDKTFSPMIPIWMDTRTLRSGNPNLRPIPMIQTTIHLISTNCCM